MYLYIFQCQKLHCIHITAQIESATNYQPFNLTKTQLTSHILQGLPNFVLVVVLILVSSFLLSVCKIILKAICHFR